MTTIQCHVQIEQALDQLGLRVQAGSCGGGVIIGEVNDGANVGDGTGEVYRDKTGVTLNFRTLKAASPNVSIVTNGDVIEIDAVTGGGNITGPDPSTLRAIATYANTTGTLLYDNKLKIDTGNNPGAYLQRALMALDDGGPAVWRDLIGLIEEGPNGGPGGLYVAIGNNELIPAIIAPGDAIIINSEGHGRIISEDMVNPWQIRKEGAIHLPYEPETARIFQLGTGGTNGASCDIYVGSSDPINTIAASPGSLYIRGDAALTNAAIYQHRGSTYNNNDWVEIGTATGLTADDISIQNVGSPPWDNVQDSINTFGMAGSAYYNSPHISDAGGATIDVAGGWGFLRASDSPELEIFAVGWSQSLGIAIPAGATRYVGIEYNGGSPQVTVRTSDNFNGHSDFHLGSVINEAGTLHILNNAQYCSDFGERIFHRFFETRPLERAERIGGIIPGSTGRYLSVSAGELYDGFNEFVISAISTAGTDTFDAYYRDGVGGWTRVAAQTQWDNANWDDGSGTLSAFAANRYGIHWLYIEADGDLVVLYGQGQYVNQATAEQAPPPSSVPSRITAHGRLLGRLVFQEGDTAYTSISDVWTQVFLSSAIAGDVYGPASSTDEAVARFDGATGKLIQNSTFRVDDSGNIYSATADTTSPVGVETTGTNGATSRTYVGNRDPNGSVTGNPGDIYIRVNGTSSLVYQHRGSASSNSDWTNLSGGSGYTPPNVGVYAYSSSSQSMTTGVWTQLTFNLERDDTGGNFSTATSRFTAPTAGRYALTVCCQITLAAAGSCDIVLVSSVHGNLAIGHTYFPNAGTVKINTAAVVYMDAGEYITADAVQYSGFTATLQNSLKVLTAAQIMAG